MLCPPRRGSSACQWPAAPRQPISGWNCILLDVKSHRVRCSPCAPALGQSVVARPRPCDPQEVHATAEPWAVQKAGRREADKYWRTITGSRPVSAQFSKKFRDSTDHATASPPLRTKTAGGHTSERAGCGRPLRQERYFFFFGPGAEGIRSNGLGVTAFPSDFPALPGLSSLSSAPASFCADRNSP